MADFTVSEENQMALWLYSILREEVDGVSLTLDEVVVEILSIAYERFKTNQSLRNKFTAVTIPATIFEVYY